MASSASRWALLPALVATLGLAGCIGAAGSSTSSGDEATTGFDSGFDEGFEGGFDEGFEGGFEGCFSYLDACYQDPYCRCFLECAEGYLETTEAYTPTIENNCLAQCGLAQLPYYMQQFIDCFGLELFPSGDDGQQPNPDTGLEGGQTAPTG